MQTDKQKAPSPRPGRGVRRIPQQSLLYSRVVPLAMLVLGVLLVLILILAAGLVLGLVPYK